MSLDNTKISKSKRPRQERIVKFQFPVGHPPTSRSFYSKWAMSGCSSNRPKLLANAHCWMGPHKNPRKPLARKGDNGFIAI